MQTYHIYGWKSDGSPLVRYGVGWAEMTKQTRAFREQLALLEVGEKKFFPFKTAAGTINYQIERVK